MTKRSEKELLDYVTAELVGARGFALPVQFDLQSLISLVGTLQLALRHPANTGASALVARSFIDATIDRLETYGFTAIAKLMRLR